MLRFAHRQQRASFRRAGLALALAASVAAAVLPAAPLARADHESGHVPVARVQVQLKRIHILDDRDGWGKGKGELHFTFFVLHFSCPNNAQHLCQDWTRNFEFSANSGATASS